MIIKKIHIENFRKYVSNDFNFHPQFNLIVGENGAGKTSLLEALAVVIGSWLLGFRGYDSRNIQKRDIRRETQFIGKRFVFRDYVPVKVEAWGEIDGELNVHWLRELNSRDSHSRTTYKNSTRIRKLAEGLAEQANKGGSVILPLISYYGADRLWALPPDSNQEIARKAPQDFGGQDNKGSDADLFSNRFIGYRYSVDNRTDLKSLLRWMAYERRSEIDDEDQSPYFRAVLTAIETCLPEHVERVRFSIRQETLMFDFDDGRIIPMSDLSEGYRNMIAIIGDIACKAVLLNPHLNEKAISETPGVVLIDELDQHLHPRWQRRIIEDLRRTFPKIQFICSTHSPFLIQSLQSGEELMVLDGQPTAELANKSVEQIAQGIMGVPNPQVSLRYEEMKGAAKRYLETLDEAANSPAEKLAEYKERLEQGIGPYASNPAFQAFLELKRAVKLGK